ncbi:MAG TPA: molybdopterin cofactor-binding domain-containing protein [Solirubrobacteraceae bacterium]|nr:molybdopterin cofactor-binding domain-containing protein [Solirubrobacteraceae bacterium]
MISPSLEQNPSLDDWIEVASDGNITLRTGKAELGQGLKGAIARIGAEELDVSLGRIRVETADTARGPDEGLTAGSRSMPDSGRAMRQAAASARAHLLALAAAELGAEANELTVVDGTVSAGGRSVTYWDLLGGRRFEVDVDGAAQPKQPEELTLLGRPGPRIDMLGLVTGTTAFVQDLAVEGMLHARVVRPPGPQSTLASVDLDAVRALPGVIAVTADGSFLGVIAEREEQALRARDALARRARWETPECLPADIHAWLLEQEPQSFLLVDGIPVPDPCAPTEPPSGAAATVHASYTRPLLMHAAIGPSAALAQWSADGARLEVHSHSQGVSPLRDSLAEVLSMAPERVRVKHVVGPGCYGHNGADDAALDAALLARAVPGRPVLLKWTREDEHAWEPYGPAMVVQARASIGSEGELLDWSADVWSTPHSARPIPHPGTSRLLAAGHLANPLPRNMSTPMLNKAGGIHRNADPLYSIATRRVAKRFVSGLPLRTSSLRALGAFANVFAIESLIDELAAAVNLDPLDVRLRNLDDARARAVLKAVAEQGGWAGRERDQEGRGSGLGFARYKNSDCYAAVLVEASVDDATSEIALERAVIAADAGQIVDPVGLINQLEGGFVQAASWTLKECVTFDAARVTSTDWESYPILRFSEVPAIETVLIDRPGEPYLGAGEATQGPTAAAIANALWAAVGLRLRELPFTPARVQKAALG